MPAAGLTCHCILLVTCCDEEVRSSNQAGLALRWLALKAAPLVMSAQRMRAFLLANATAAICQPERSRNVHSQFEILSERRCAVSTADLA